MSRSEDVSDLKGKMSRFVNGSKVIAVFVKYSRGSNSEHSNYESIRLPNMFGIRAPTVMGYLKAEKSKFQHMMTGLVNYSDPYCNHEIGKFLFT